MACRTSLHDRARQRVLGVPLHAKGEAQHVALIATAERNDCRKCWSSFRERARLVEAHHGNFSESLEVRTALDQHPAARGTGQATHDGDGRRNNERAGTRDDKHRERPVHPLVPPARSKQRGNDGEQHRDHDHRRGVDSRELVHETLTRSATGLRFLHSMDDSRERRVACRFRRANLENALSIQGAGKYVVADCLVHGH